MIAFNFSSTYVNAAHQIRSKNKGKSFIICKIKTKCNSRLVTASSGSNRD